MVAKSIKMPPEPMEAVDILAISKILLPKVLNYGLLLLMSLTPKEGLSISPLC